MDKKQKKGSSSSNNNNASSSSSGKKASMKMNDPLPPSIEEKRTKVGITYDTIKHPATYESASVFMSHNFDNSFDIDEFQQNFQVKIISLTDEEAIFDLIGIDPAIANAFRRIMISEVPTMAIEHVFMMDNTGIMQDEIMAQRLGLIPIKADPNEFTYREGDQPTDADTIVFRLNVRCERNPNCTSEDAPPNQKYINDKVLSRHLEWVPAGEQGTKFAADPIRPVLDDILITKMRPGQNLEVELHCVKGIGQTHAKWSPVSTASYRLMPEITLTKEVRNEQADELVNLCPMKVFDIEDLGDGDRRARVANPRVCSMCRECVRDVKWQDKVKLARVKNHFIFSVESAGQIPARQIFLQAINVFMEKLTVLETELNKLRTGVNVAE